jgi:Ni/Fe-hydrogenase subunit HybB-like protein
VLALHYDVGRPWRLPYPFFVQQGTTSLLFEVAACVALYLTVLFIEFSPAAMEWLGPEAGAADRGQADPGAHHLRRGALHAAPVVAGGLVSDRALQAAPALVFALPTLYFFVSSIIAGLSMVIFESTMAHRYFHDKMDAEHLRQADGVALGFGKAAAWVLAGYFVIKVIGIAQDDNWHLSGHRLRGLVSGGVAGLRGLLPCYAFAIGVRDKNLKLIRWTAAWSVMGIVVNRFNVGLIAFNYHLPSSERYFPHWMEIAISVFVVTIGVLVLQVHRDPHADPLLAPGLRRTLTAAPRTDLWTTRSSPCMISCCEPRASPTSWWSWCSSASRFSGGF